MSWEKVERDVERGPFGLFKWLAIAIVSFTILFAGLRYAGIIGTTIVEREVFTQSYQYKAGMEARGAILEANLVEVNEQIRNSATADERAGFESQKRVFEAQLRAITINE